MDAFIGNGRLGRENLFSGTCLLAVVDASHSLVWILLQKGSLVEYYSLVGITVGLLPHSMVTCGYSHFYLLLAQQCSMLSTGHSNGTRMATFQSYGYTTLAICSHATPSHLLHGTIHNTNSHEYGATFCRIPSSQTERCSTTTTSSTTSCSPVCFYHVSHLPRGPL